MPRPTILSDSTLLLLTRDIHFNPTLTPEEIVNLRPHTHIGEDGRFKTSVKNRYHHLNTLRCRFPQKYTALVDKATKIQPRAEAAEPESDEDEFKPEPARSYPDSHSSISSPPSNRKPRASTTHSSTKKTPSSVQRTPLSAQ